MPQCAVSYKTYLCKCHTDVKRYGCPSHTSQASLDFSGAARLSGGEPLQLRQLIRHERLFFTWYKSRDPDGFEKARQKLHEANLVTRDEQNRQADKGTCCVCACHVNPAAVYKDTAGNWQLDSDHETPFRTIDDWLLEVEPARRRTSAFDRSAAAQAKRVPSVAKYKDSSDHWERMYHAKCEELRKATDQVAQLDNFNGLLAQELACAVAAADAASAEEQLREEQLIDMAQYVMDLEGQIHALQEALVAKEGVIPTLTSEQKKALLTTTRAFMDAGKFDFTLSTIKAICDEANAPGEYMYLTSMLSETTRAHLSGGDAAASTKRMGVKASWVFILRLQTMGHRVNLTSTALDLMTVHMRNDFYQSVSGHSKRTARRRKKEALASFNQTISAHLVRECREPVPSTPSQELASDSSAAQEFVVSEPWRRIPFLCDDDFTRYVVPSLPAHKAAAASAPHSLVDMPIYLQQLQVDEVR